jgi:hypothetical protein
MRLVDVVKAYCAAVEMMELSWPFDLALAVVKVKRVAAVDFEFFVARERELVLEYAAVDVDGNVRLSGSGARFVFADPARGAEYERERALLADVEVVPPPVLRVRRPAEIRPDWLEALDGFVEFVDDGFVEVGAGGPVAGPVDRVVDRPADWGAGRPAGVSVGS